MPFANFDGHLAQLGENPSTKSQRPPIVEINFHGSPHRHPPGDGKPLLDKIGQDTGSLGQENLGDEKTKAQEGETHHQAGTSLPHQAFEFQMIEPRPVCEIVVDRFNDEIAGAVSFGWLVQIDD